MAETSKLEIVTPEAIVYSEDAEMVTLTRVEGQMRILPQHVAIMTQLIPGEMIVRKACRDEFLALGEGFVEVTGRRVSVLTDMAVEGLPHRHFVFSTPRSSGVIFFMVVRFYRN